MAVNYTRVNWDTTKYVNPTNMNQMDKGIKDCADGVTKNEADITEINTKLSNNIEVINVPIAGTTMSGSSGAYWGSIDISGRVPSGYIPISIAETGTWDEKTTYVLNATYNNDNKYFIDFRSAIESVIMDRATPLKVICIKTT